MVSSQWTLRGWHDKKFWFTASLLIKIFYSVSGVAKQVMYCHRGGHNPKCEAETVSVTFF